jgi:hypothetical protein
MFKLNLMPRGDKFFDLFEVSAKNMVKAAENLKELIYSWDCIDQKLEEMDRIEHQGDTITHEIMYQLNRSFITPFDREDIGTLAHSLDDVTDLIQATADTMVLYKVREPGKRARELADILVQITTEVENVILDVIPIFGKSNNLYIISNSEIWRINLPHLSEIQSSATLTITREKSMPQTIKILSDFHTDKPDSFSINVIDKTDNQWSFLATLDAEGKILEWTQNTIKPGAY